ncbi:transcription factor [Mucor ambiguus]|uniref:Transcription factor n=1 Tax=Mucor ambiguus TaxID=91626 RepID=A0A0C9MHN6_9FUNG|nr:transcription factor [Mucor ambiguus]
MMEEPSFQPIITLYDAVTDSPVFRSSVYRYDQQLEHLEHWLDSLSRHLKLYAEKLNKFNADTLTLCQKAVPDGLDETLIDPNFTGVIIKGFADALQTSLSFKTNLIHNLEEILVSPLQQFVKTHLRDFKNFRKQHEKAMEKYESQLAKYSGLSKSKEPSSVREEAFRLHEARKEYVKMSGQHVLRILNFRSLLEHCLVERFTAATVAHKDFYKDIQVWANLDAALSYWKQWLMDDKVTCSFQLHRQQIARRKLEDEFIRLTAPERDIGKYVTPLQTEKSDGSMMNSKWGYLFVRVSRHSWSRKWFFIHDGYFGVCQVNSSGKHKSTISIEAKIRLANCQVHAAADTDRRFCFEVVQPKQQASFVLQAETEEIKQEWLRVFDKNMQLFDGEKAPSSPMSLTKSPALIRSKSTATTALSSPTATTNSDILRSNTSSPKIKHTDSSSSFSNISIISNNHQKYPLISDSSLTLYRNSSEEGASIVMVSTTPDTEASLTNSSSLTPLLVWEASRGTSSPSTTSIDTAASAKHLPAGTWGIPWSLVPTMMNLTQDFSVLDPNATKASAPAAPLPQIIWPAKPASVHIPDVDIEGYPEKMTSQNRELRRLFGGVKAEEVVLDVFVCCLRKQLAVAQQDTTEIETAKSTTSLLGADMYDKELEHHLAQTGLKPPSDFGYAYTGRGFITQTTFWFYSCVLLTCINSVAVRLKDIDQVTIVKDTSLAHLVNETALAMNSDLVISITLLPNSRSDIKEPLILGTLMEDIEITAEKLRFAVSNAKKEEAMQSRDAFNKMLDISKNSATHKSVVVDLPLSFNSALSHIACNTAERNTGTIVSAVPKSSIVAVGRPHAATVGPEARVSPASILKPASRQRGESEPLKPVLTTTAIKSPPKKTEPPKPDPDMPPSNIECPDTAVECHCDDHLERKDAQITLPISAKRCYDLLFSNEQTAAPTDGGVWAEKTAAIEGHDLSVSKWGMVDGKMQRVLKYWMPVSNPIVRMKEAEVVETQVLIQKKDYIRYTVQISTKTAALPYADAFIPSVRYCITWISKSECQLTCYLGVRWVKSVLVRAIVTRAALKGMADSVGLFIPILQAAAENIKESVDETRKQVMEHNKSLLKNDTVASQVASGMDSVSEEEGQSPATNHEDMLESASSANEVSTQQRIESSFVAPGSIVQPVAVSTSLTTTNAGKTFERATPSPSVSSTTTALEKESDISLDIPSKHQQRTKRMEQLPRQNARREVVKSVTPQSSKQQAEPATEKHWLSTIADHVPINLKTVAMFILMCFTVYMSTIWVRSGHSVAGKADEFLHPNITSKETTLNYTEQRPVYLQKSTSRSVYLRDLDEGFLKNTIQPPYANSISFKAFLQSKISDVEAKEQHVAEYAINSRHWYDVEHYRLAVDLDISRDRIAVLRHDMLTIFQVLNKLDTQLVENEYTNWLLDTRLKCKYYPSLPEQDPRAEKAVGLCRDVKGQLDKLF